MRISDWSSDVCSSDLQVTSAGTPYQGPRSPISVGKFDNQSSFMRGVFSDGVDRVGNQAKTILVSHLQQSGRFNVLDRTNMGEIGQEAALKGQAQTIKGADYVITGDVSEFRSEEHTSELQSLMRISYAVFCLKK